MDAIHVLYGFWLIPFSDLQVNILGKLSSILGFRDIKQRFMADL